FVLTFAQGGLYRPLARRVREVTFTWIGTLLMAVGMAGLGFIAYLATWESQSRWYNICYMGLDRTFLLIALLAVLAIAVTGFAFMTPSVQALISRLSDPGRQGEILGVNQSASAMARILGPAAGVPLYFLTPTHTLPYVFGTGLLLI